MRFNQFFVDQFPEFIENDNRKFRRHTQSTAESMIKKLECCVPAISLAGKTVLDIGSCVGAAGAWALFNGAKHYTGIEIQETYAEISERLLESHWDKSKFSIVRQDAESFLKECEKFDIIICLGVIYSVGDIISFVKRCTELCNDYLVIDSLQPSRFYNKLPVIEVGHMHMTAAPTDETIQENKFAAFFGLGLKPSLEALSTIFWYCGFRSERLFPEPTVESQDIYNDTITQGCCKPTTYTGRYILKCYRDSSYSVAEPLVKALRNNDQGTKKDFPEFEKQPYGDAIKKGEWKFDEQVAKRFRQEALNNIPDYIKVISMSVSKVKSTFPNDWDERYVIDVGSALGETVQTFVDTGFKNVFGVECSKDMITHSKCLDRIIYSSELPLIVSPWDAVIINWTLHFIHEREEYLKDVFNKMSNDGVLIITDKNDYTDLQHIDYVNFKLDRGMSRDEIIKKTNAIKGVLVTKPLEWYFDTLAKVGFVDIEVINSRFMFNTIVCRKRA